MQDGEMAGSDQAGAASQHNFDQIAVPTQLQAGGFCLQAIPNDKDSDGQIAARSSANKIKRDAEQMKSDVEGYRRMFNNEAAAVSIAKQQTTPAKF